MARKDYGQTCPQCNNNGIIIRHKWKGMAKKARRTRIERCMTCNYYLRRES